MSSLSRHAIDLDLFTDAYRISGSTQVGGSGLLTELNNPNSDYLELQEVYLSPIQAPGKIIASYKEGSVRKANINFVLLQDRRDGTTMGTPGTALFGRARPVTVFITVPSFEVHGDVMHEGKPTTGNMLAASSGRFQAVFDAEASASLYPDISYSGDLILVQKEQIGVFCLAEHKG